MTDEAVRQAERAASQGDSEARARVLGARLRQGETSAERLRLAALLGDPAAALVAPPDGDLYQALLACGKEAAVRLCLASTRLVLPVWLRVHPELDEDLDPLAPLQAAKEFALCPCTEHQDTLVYELNAIPNLFGEQTPLSERPVGPCLEYAADAAAQAAFFCVMCVDARARQGASEAQLTAATTSHALQLARRSAQEALGGASEETARGLLRGAAELEVVPWLLGEDDPLRYDAPVELPDLLGQRAPDPILSDPAYWSEVEGTYRRGAFNYTFEAAAEGLVFLSANERWPLLPDVGRVYTVFAPEHSAPSEDALLTAQPLYFEFVSGDVRVLRTTNRRWGTRSAPRID